MRFDSGKESVAWLQKEYREGNLTLRPPYQRKPVWAARQKCYLIESILLGMPVPEIFFHETTTPEGKTIHAVVDGQQRVRAVLQFIGLGTPEEDEQEFIGFALDKLDRKGPPSPFFGKRFTDLTNDERVRLYEYKFHIRYLYVSDEAELRGMFTRLNRYLTALNAQELRHATYVGPFPKLAEKLAEDEYWLNSRLVSRALVRRLGDVDFVSQLLIGLMHGPEGGGSAVVDEYYRRYEDYDAEEGIPDQERVERQFRSTLQFLKELFPSFEAPSVRWGNRTDFYSLFVALAEVLRDNGVPKGKLATVRNALRKFGVDVDHAVAHGEVTSGREAVEYAQAVEKGANEKARRADRHRILVAVLERAAGAGGKRKPVGRRARKAK